MCKTSKLSFNSRILLNSFRKLLTVLFIPCRIKRNTLGNHDYKIAFSAFLLCNKFLYCSIFIKRNFLNSNSRRPGRYSCLKSDISCRTSHNFYYIAAAMRITCITETIHHLDNCIHSRIKANRLIRRRNIVVNCTWKADTRNPVFCKVGCPPECSVSADCDDSVYVVIYTGSLGFQNTFFITKLVTTIRPKNCSAPTYYIINITFVKYIEIFMNKSLVSFINTDNFNPVRKRRTGNRTNGRIHSRSISA